MRGVRVLQPSGVSATDSGTPRPLCPLARFAAHARRGDLKGGRSQASGLRPACATGTGTARSLSRRSASGTPRPVGSRLRLRARVTPATRRRCRPCTPLRRACCPVGAPCRLARKRAPLALVVPGGGLLAPSLRSVTRGARCAPAGGLRGYVLPCSYVSAQGASPRRWRGGCAALALRSAARCLLVRPSGGFAVRRPV